MCQIIKHAHFTRCCRKKGCCPSLYHQCGYSNRVKKSCDITNSSLDFNITEIKTVYMFIRIYFIHLDIKNIWIFNVTMKSFSFHIL